MDKKTTLENLARAAYGKGSAHGSNVSSKWESFCGKYEHPEDADFTCKKL